MGKVVGEKKEEEERKLSQTVSSFASFANVLVVDDEGETAVFCLRK